MMRPYKRIFSIVLAMAMVLAVGVTASASPEDESTSTVSETEAPTPTPVPTGRITILNPGNASYRAYKIFDVTYDRPAAEPEIPAAEPTVEPSPAGGDASGPDTGSGGETGSGEGNSSGNEPDPGTGTNDNNDPTTTTESTTPADPDPESGTNPAIVYTIDTESVWLDVVYNVESGESEFHGLKFTAITGSGNASATVTGYTVTKEAGFSAEAFAKYLKENIPGGATPIPFHGSSAGFLEDGYYLVIASEDVSGQDAGQASLAQEKAMLVTVLDGREVRAENKNDMPFDKTVEGEKVKDALIGETLTFEIETKIPYDVIVDAAGNSDGGDDPDGSDPGGNSGPGDGGNGSGSGQEVNTQSFYAFYVSDKMDEGLEFNENSFKVTIGTVEFTVANSKLTEETASETSTLTGNQVRFGKNGKTFELSLDMIDLVQNQGLAEGTKITISYEATVTSAVMARIAENHAVLEYGSDPEDLTVKDSKALVYNYQIDVYKHDTSEDGPMLEGAKFVLYRERDASENTPVQEGSGVISPEPPPMTEPSMEYYQEIYKTYDTGQLTELTEGTHYETVTAGEGAESTTTYYALKDGKRVVKEIRFVPDRSQATEFTTGGDGHVAFVGLTEGTYYLEETEAPDDFTRLTEPIVIELNEKDFITPGLTDEQVHEKLEKTSNVINISGTELPSTGGPGAALFYIGGLLLAVMGCAALVIRRRMSL